MSQELPVFVALPSGPVEELFPPPTPAAQQDQALTEPSPEHVRAVEAVFAQQQHENAAVANLLGLYTSGVLLHNLAAAALAPGAEEVKKMPKLKKEEEPE